MCIRDRDKSSDLAILDLLNVLFSTTTTPEEKKQRLHNEFEIVMMVEFESEVQEMCNLSEALVEQGRAERNISVSYTHLDVYKRQQWRCWIIK